eukprot:9440909-Pyramimonas_sp.AAC.1
MHCSTRTTREKQHDAHCQGANAVDCSPWVANASLRLRGERRKHASNQPHECKCDSSEIRREAMLTSAREDKKWHMEMIARLSTAEAAATQR